MPAPLVELVEEELAADDEDDEDPLAAAEEEPEAAEEVVEPLPLLEELRHEVSEPALTVT